MRFFAALLAYLVGLSAVISIGIVGLMALQSPIEPTRSAPIVATAHEERLAKSVKQTIVNAGFNQKQKMAQRPHKNQRPNQKHNIEQVPRMPTHKPIAAGYNAYGYAEEPGRINPNLFPFYGPGLAQPPSAQR